MARKKPQPNNAPVPEVETTGPTAQIVEQVDVRAAPLPNGPPNSNSGIVSGPMNGNGPGIQTTLRADPKTEYVASQGLTQSSAFAESLPAHIDSIQGEFGADIYERMYRGDGHVAGEVNALFGSALSGDVILECAVENPGDPKKKALSLPGPIDPMTGKPTKPARPEPEPDASEKAKQTDYDNAEEARRFCQHALANLDGDLSATLRDMARAIYLGHRVAEIVYRAGDYTDEETGETRPALLLDRLKVKKRYSFAFVVDNRRNVLGLVATIAGRVTTILQPTLIDLTGAENLLPREKFAVMTWRPEDSDPRGTSLLRAAYNAWWLKHATMKEQFRFLCNVAGGPTWGTTAEGASNAEDGTTPEQAMATTSATIKNGSSVAYPFGSTLQPVYDMRGATGDAFTSAEDFYNSEITKAIVSAALATNDSQHQTKSATGTQKDIVDLIGEEIEKGIAGMIRGDILRPLLKLNYGEAWEKYTPKVSLSQAEEADMGPVADALAKLKAGGILQKAQLPWAWSLVGAPVIETEEMDAEPVPPMAPGQPMPGQPAGQGKATAPTPASSDDESAAKG
jgi:hypothetical protein